MKHNIKNQSIAVLLVASLACAPLTSCNNMSDSMATQIQATGIGTLTGAGVGAGVGALVSDDENRGTAIATGAAIGAVVGGLIGYQWGKSVALKKSQYKETEDYIEANINQLDDRIDEAESYNKKLSRQVAQLKKDNQRISAAEYNKCNTTINDGVKQINTALSSARTASKYASGSEKQELASKIATLEKEKQMLLSNRSALRSRRARA